MNTVAVYQNPDPGRHDDERINLTKPLRDEFLGLSAMELEDERSRYLILRDSTRDERDRAIWQSKLDRIESHIARAKKIAGMRWPDQTRSDALTTLARTLKAAVPLHQFIDDEIMATRLVPYGDRYKGRCPIHDEHSPSFIVYPDNGWYCFGACHRGGDIYELIGLVFGLPNWSEQVRFLADYYEGRR